LRFASWGSAGTALELVLVGARLENVSRRQPHDVARPCAAIRAIHWRVVIRALFCIGALVCLALPSTARAEPTTAGNPLAYDLRIGVFPVVFQGGQSQSWFGSALRAEYGVHPRFDVGVNGRFAWGPVAGQPSRHGLQTYSAGIGLVWHIHQLLQREQLVGTVYPANPPMIAGPGPGTDHDLEMPVHQRLGDAPIVLDHPDGETVVRRVHSLRLGLGYARLVSGSSAGQPVINGMPILHAGFGWGTHWNVDPSVTGKAEIGFRRYYIDLLVTLPSLTSYRVLDQQPQLHPGLFPGGVRIGMEGAIDAFYRAIPGFGFAYSLELGLMPGRPGLDAATR
jgi:hypothetical protein